MDGAPLPDPTLRDLFLGFLKIGMMGFGGVGAVSRYVIVVERRWVDDTDFARILGFCQALPGANSVNLGVMLGDRYRGPLGALACVAGLMAVPLVILVIAATVYDRIAGYPLAQVALTGAAVSASGLILGNAARLLVSARPSAAALACAAVALVAVAGFRFPLAWVLACVAPFSLGAAVWATRRR